MEQGFEICILIDFEFKALSKLLISVKRKVTITYGGSIDIYKYRWSDTCGHLRKETEESAHVPVYGRLKNSHFHPTFIIRTTCT